ncbi:hypothetical protein LTR53_004640 [Teratosphaeriaceae sp. CCFEE 6253]|nr:hypothetical protein LTR53_004640 [Teratosphaeriaceae sp. CCFEE 6253]
MAICEASIHQDTAESSPQLDRPVDIDSERCPQLNTLLCRSRRCGCACASSRNSIPTACSGGVQIVEAILATLARLSNIESDDRTAINGEEGLDARKIEIGDLGMASIRDIAAALAKHIRCTCPCGAPSDFEDFPLTGYNTPLDVSGFLSHGSMIVECDEGESTMGGSSLASSTIDIGNRSTSPSELMGLIGAQFGIQVTQPNTRNLFAHTPILHGHEAEYYASMNIGIGHRMRDSVDLSIGDNASSGHSAYDMW